MALGSVLLGFAAGSGGDTVGSAFAPASRAVGYIANRDNPNLVPTIQQLVGAYHQGILTFKESVALLAKLGVPFGELKSDGTPLPARVLRRVGLEWRKIIEGQRTIPSPAETLVLVNRQVLSPEQGEALLRLHGFSTTTERKAILGLRFDLPGQSDLIRFALREVWSADVVRRFGYDEEFPQPFQHWMDRIGLGSDASMVVDGKQIGDKLSWPQAYWRAHWEVMSPTQSYEALHRLRPNRGHLFQGLGIEYRPFDVQDVKTVLKIHDYPVAFRDWLTLISYRPIARIDIRRVYKSGIWGEPKGAVGFRRRPDGGYEPTGIAETELVERNQDFGYTREDAITLARWTAQDTVKVKPTPEQKRLHGLVCQSFADGALTHQQALALLRDAALEEPEAFRKLGNCERTYRLKRLRTALTVIRKGYLSGRINEGETRGELALIGVLPDRIDEHISLWDLQRRVIGKEAVATQLCEWRGHGMINDVEMKRRLVAVGWRDEDATRIVQTCLLGHFARSSKDRDRLLRAAAKEAERQAKIVEQRQKAQAQVAEKAAKAVERVRDEQLAARTPTRLHQWVDAERISREEAIASLVEQGWLIVDAQREFPEPEESE